MTDAPATLATQYRALARYNTWMNERLYTLCGTMTDAERRRDRGAFFRSIHGTLNHVLLADRAWLGRCTDDPEFGTSRDAAGRPIAVRSLDQELYADFGVLTRERAATDAALEVWVDGLDEARLRAHVRYRTSAGQSCDHPLWQALTHLFNHQTHHRGQVTTLLRQCGRDPGVTDFVAFVGDAAS
jgi:uncharacterized damage-inducible protein DinB